MLVGDRQSFLPSFDSRGNLGTIEDENEFSKTLQQSKLIKDKQIPKASVEPQSDGNISEDIPEQIPDQIQEIPECIESSQEMLALPKLQ